jgi:hypothetical protein
LFALRVFVLSISVSAGAVLCAQELPGVDQVIGQRGVGERGQHAGKGAALLLKGNIEASNPEESGPFEIYIRSPRVAINLSDGALRSGFDGKQLWRSQRGQPTVALPAGPLLEAVAVFDPARRFHWRESFPRIAVVRRQQISDRDAFVLETEPGAPGALRFFIDVGSGDLARAELLPGLTFDMSEYRTVSGWRIPFRIVQTLPQGSVYTFRADKAMAMDVIDDAVFSTP